MANNQDNLSLTSLPPLAATSVTTSAQPASSVTSFNNVFERELNNQQAQQMQQAQQLPQMQQLQQMQQPPQMQQLQQMQQAQQPPQYTTQYASQYDRILPQQNVRYAPPETNALTSKPMAENDMNRYILIGVLVILCIYLLYKITRTRRGPPRTHGGSNTLPRRNRRARKANKIHHF